MPTQNEIDSLVATLKSYDPGYYPFPVFLEMCRLNKLTALEIVPIIPFKPGNPKIVFYKRPSDDYFWPNEYHTPGCIVRPTDTIELTKERVLSHEMKDVSISKEPVFVSVDDYTSKRWESLILLHWVEFKEAPAGSTLFEYKQLANENIVKSQIPFINKAVAHYLAFSAASTSST